MEQKLKPLHLACANDDLRPNMFLIEIKNGIASATNGSIVIKTELSQTSLLTPEEIEILNDKYIHKEVWKEIYKCEFLEFDDG